MISRCCLRFPAESGVMERAPPRCEPEQLLPRRADAGAPVQPPLQRADRRVRRERKVRRVRLPLAAGDQARSGGARRDQQEIARLPLETEGAHDRPPHLRLRRRLRLHILLHVLLDAVVVCRHRWQSARCTLVALWRTRTAALEEGAQLRIAPRMSSRRWLQVVGKELRLQLGHALAEARGRFVACRGGAASAAAPGAGFGRDSDSGGGGSGGRAAAAAARLGLMLGIMLGLEQRLRHGLGLIG